MYSPAFGLSAVMWKELLLGVLELERWEAAYVCASGAAEPASRKGCTHPGAGVKSPQPLQEENEVIQRRCSEQLHTDLGAPHW